MADKEKLSFSIFDSAAKVVPTFIEKENTGKPYVNYGVDNRFPNYLWELYLRSAVLQSIINGTADYAGGNGIIYNPSPLVQRLKNEANKDGETLDDVIKKAIIDYLVFGGFALQIINNKLGEVNEIIGWISVISDEIKREIKFIIPMIGLNMQMIMLLMTYLIRKRKVIVRFSISKDICQEVFIQSHVIMVL